MGGWFDNDPMSPVVEFERDDGMRVPVPRSQATLFGFDPAQFAPAPSPVDPPPEDVASVEQPVAPEPPPPPMAPGFAALRPPLPEGSASAFGQGVLAPGGPAPEQPTFVPPPMAAPVAPLPPVEPQGPTLPGVGYIPAASLGLGQPPPEAPPPPTGPQSMEEIDQQLADQRVAMQSRADVEAENLAFQQAQERAEEQKQLRARWNDTQSAIKKAAEYKVDPGRKWADMSTGKKIGAIVFAAVSGLGSALKKQGDKNPALDIINAAIDQDIALQMDERSQLGVVAERSRSAYDQLTGVFKGRDAERSARKAAIWGRLEREWSMAEASSGSERVQFAYADLRQQAAQQQHDAAYNAYMEETKTAADLDHKAAQTAKLQAETAKLLGGGGGAGGVSIGGAAKAGGAMRFSDAQVQQMKREDRERMVRLPDKSWVPTNSRSAAEKGTEVLASSAVMVGNIDRALTKVASMPGFAAKIASGAGFESSDIATIKQELTQLMLNGKNFYVLGALSENDEAIINRLGADPSATTAFVENVWPKLQNWRHGIEQDALTQLSARGVDIDASTAYGDALERPRSKTVDEWTAEITSDPPELENSHDVRGGGESRTVTTYEYKVPTTGSTKQALRGMRETAQSEGWDDKKWASHLDRIDRDHKLNAVRLAGKADGFDADAKKAEKKGGKGKAEALQLRKKAAAARAASAEYQKLKPVVDEQRKAQIDRDRKRADEKKGQAEFSKVQREQLGGKF